MVAGQSATGGQRAFTLVELMVTVAVVAILAAIAAPSYRSFVTGQRVQAASADLATALMLTRSEAIKRNANVTMNSSSGTGDWEDGWTITAASTTVLTQDVLSSVVIAASSPAVTFNRSGRLNTASPVAFEIGDATAGSSVAKRCVTIGVTGQPATKQGGC